ncbi:hypothetical protein JB92DRAFT_3103902 [Gautieria morchelliformis]|nr:hypothetical protein JB92DRAFT_3103902 [Gautieria morchelliformis]
MSSLKNVNTEYDTSFRSTKYIHPGELIDQVIDHLHDDPPSLRACCITCRAWVPSARFHIFHDIVLSAEHADALAVLLETSPHISPLVRSLTINGHLDKMHKGLDYYLEAVIPAIAPKLTRLKTLRVERVTLAKQHPKVLSALIHNFSTLQELHISVVLFNRFRDLAALIVAHPFLECLDLGAILWNFKSVTAESHVFQEYPALHSRLRCIKWHSISLSVIDWLSAYYHVLPVHTVTQISYISIHELPQMARLLQLIGSSLEHVAFSISQRSPEKPKMDVLSSNTGLRTLTFNSILLSLEYPRTYAWLPVLLSQVTSHYIEEISFGLNWYQVKLIETVDLKLVQDIITKPVFSGLKRVIFQWYGGVDPVEGSQAIRAQMDQLNRMGLLVFRHE